ncbi:MAG TPA: FAD-dependent oxidoreductase [Drouetiella sp.]
MPPETADSVVRNNVPEKAESHSSSPNLLSVFEDGLKSSLSMPVVGTKQIFGDQAAAKEYFKEQDSSQLQGAEKYAHGAGSMIGNAAVFIGTTLLAKRIPLIGQYAPVIAGAALGYFEPLSDSENGKTRFAHAALGAATVSVLEYAPKAVPTFGMKAGIASDIMKVGVAGFGAGVLNTEGQSLLKNGQFASMNDAVTGGFAWGLTGAALHGVGYGVTKMKPFGVGTPNEGQVFFIGSRYNDDSFATRDFLQKNLIPFKVFEPENNYFARRVLNNATNGGAEGNSMLIFSDGKRMICPKPQELAEKLGMQTKPTQEGYDTVIVGAGPAGMQASIYGSSEGLRTLLVDGRGPGGQAGTTSRVENFMGFENGITGPELMSKAFVQSKRLGTEFILNEAQQLRRDAEGSLFVKLKDGSEVRTRSVVLATGVQFREMTDVPGMTELQGKGVYYGSALTEAPLTKAGEKVVIVGGANSAGQAAVKFSELVGAKGEVTILTRSPLEKSMSEYLINQIKDRPNIKVEVGTAVNEVAGNGKLESVAVKNLKTGEVENKPSDSMFVFIGSAPKTHWLSDQLAVDESGFLKAGVAIKDTDGWKFERDPFANETSMPGVFVAGDVHAGSQQRIITAAAEGATSIGQVHRWLTSPEAATGYGYGAPKAAPFAPLPTGDISAIWSGTPGHPGNFLRNATLWGTHERSRAVLPLHRTA